MKTPTLILLCLISSQLCAQQSKPIQEMKSELSALKKTVNQLKADLALISKSTNEINENVRLLGSRSFIENEYVSQYLIENIKEAEDIIIEEQEAYKKFIGTDQKCSSGSECYNYKKDMKDLVVILKELFSTFNSSQNQVGSVIDFDFILSNLDNRALYSVKFYIPPSHLAMMIKECKDLIEYLKTVKFIMSELDVCEKINLIGYDRIKDIDIKIYKSSLGFTSLGTMVNIMFQTTNETTIAISGNGITIPPFKKKLAGYISTVLLSAGHNLSKIHLSIINKYYYCKTYDLLTEINSK